MSEAVGGNIQGTLQETGDVRLGIVLHAPWRGLPAVMAHGAELLKSLPYVEGLGLVLLDGICTD